MDAEKINTLTFSATKSHAGKVVLRGWYERNKHIFPASRWEAYDPEKKWEKYTVRLAIPSREKARDCLHSFLL